MNARSLAAGKPGFAKNAVLPTISLKERDRERLDLRQSHHRVLIHIWHVFFDRAFGLPFDEAKHLILSGKIAPTVQVFQAPGGATTKKCIYKIYYHYAYELGVATAEPALKAQVIVDKNGHVLPYVALMVALSNSAMLLLRHLKVCEAGTRHDLVGERFERLAPIRASTREIAGERPVLDAELGC